MNQSMPILSRPAGQVAMITLNRPDVANRIQPEDLEELSRLLSHCERDDDVHVLVLAANGAYFSAGFDLRALVAGANGGTLSGPDGDSAFEQFADHLEQTRLIVIAAINGPVIGGSTDIALACDLRFAADTAYMLMPAAKFGLPLYAGALQRYVSRLGLNHAKRLVFTAQKVDAHDMLSIGFVTELVAEAALHSRVLEVACAIAAMPSKPLAAMKQVLNASALSAGTAKAQRDALRCAFDGAHVAALVTATQAGRRPNAQELRC